MTVDAVPTLRADTRTLHGWFDHDLPPVLTVDPGTTVRFETLDSGWFLEPDTGGDVADRRRAPGYTPDAGHALTGPVQVRGARAGQVLAVRVDSVVPASWGTAYAGLAGTAWNARLGITGPAVHGWAIDVAAGTARNQHGHTVAVRPFLGIIGMPPAEPGRHSTIPPRWHGGNLDCRELVAGSTLYLPIPVDGALLSVGDAHAAQGDGEVCVTGIECPMYAALRFDLHKSRNLPASQFATPGPLTPKVEGAGWYATMGVNEDLMQAAKDSLRAMVEHVSTTYHIEPVEAYVLASLVVDLKISEIVDRPNWIVSSYLPLAIFG